MAARILVVDDLLPNRKLLEAKLKSEYYEVETVESGILAIESIKKRPPDVILLDVMMPDMDGFETCRRIKQDPASSDIPVVMVTALSDVEDRVEGLTSGADDFLTKPINDLALFARIRSLVRLKSITDEMKRRIQTGEQFGSSEEERAHIDDVKDAKVLVVDDDMSQAQQIKLRLLEEGINVDIISEPPEAVKASEENDYHLIMVSTQLVADDGLHLCTHFRSQEKTKHTPLLIIIEEDSTDLLIKGLDMGINDYLVTPIDSNEVSARVKIQIKRKKYQDALHAKNEESLEMAVVDGLTRVYNRRYFDSHLERMLKDALDSGKPLALAIIDIDHFKSVNDDYGHLSGDEVLKNLPQRVKACVRPSDLVARYGGEEFCVLMPSTTLVQAANVAERIRKKVESEDFAISAEPGSLHCTISVGISVANDGDSPESLIDRADKGLYHVKTTGRNKVAVYSDVKSDSGGIR